MDQCCNQQHDNHALHTLGNQLSGSHRGLLCCCPLFHRAFFGLVLLVGIKENDRHRQYGKQHGRQHAKQP